MTPGPLKSNLDNLKSEFSRGENVHPMTPSLIARGRNDYT